MLRLWRGDPGQPGYDPFFVTGLSAEALRQEVFFLSYHLHWSWTEIMGLESSERREFVKLLAKQIERENAQVQAARQK
ncbi:MAG: DUF6760 family protein [Planctomycetota bacterium]